MELAEQLRIRVNAATSSKDTEAVRQLQGIGKNSTLSPESRDGNQNPPKPEDPPSKDQPKPNDKRKRLVTIGLGIVPTLVVVGSGIYLQLQPKVPPCSSTKDLCKIFPQVGNGKEYTWPGEQERSSYPNYKQPTYNYVSNDGDCGGSSSPVLKLQYEFPDKNQVHSGWAVVWPDGFDFSKFKFSTLDFRIKRVFGKGKFEVGLKDKNKNGDQNKVLKSVESNDWKPISIPLSKFGNTIEKSEITNINTGFLSQNGSGTICIDKIQLR